MTTASPAENISAAISAWQFMVARMPGATIAQADGVAASFANTPLAFFNFSVIDQPFATADGLRGAVATAAVRARACPHPSMLAVCADWLPPEWPAIAADAGLALSMNITGMMATGLKPPRRPPPVLDYRCCDTLATAVDLAQVNGRAYGMAPEAFEPVANLRLWQAGGFGVVGYVDGRPVASTGAFIIGGMTYIAMVATEPDCQGKGYAEAVMRHAIGLALAAGGSERLWLHATDMGRPVYAAMGFADAGAMPIYHWE